MRSVAIVSGTPSGACSFAVRTVPSPEGETPRKIRPASDRLSRLKLYCLDCSPISTSCRTSGKASALVFGIGSVVFQLTPSDSSAFAYAFSWAWSRTIR